MTPEALNLALAESFEPKPPEGRPHPAAPQPKCWVQVSDNPPPAGTVSDPWWDFQFGKYSWQPRNFTDPDLTVMMMEWILGSAPVRDSWPEWERVWDQIAGFHMRPGFSLPASVAEFCAKFRGVWKEDS